MPGEEGAGEMDRKGNPRTPVLHLARRVLPRQRQHLRLAGKTRQHQGDIHRATQLCQLPRHTVRHLQATENTRREGRSRQGESGVPYRRSHRRKHQRHTRQGHQHARRQGAAHVPVESDGEVCHRSKPIQKHQGARLRGSCRLCRDNEKPIRQVQHIPEVGAQRHFATVATATSVPIWTVTGRWSRGSG